MNGVSWQDWETNESVGSRAKDRDIIDIIKISRLTLSFRIVGMADNRWKDGETNLVPSIYLLHDNLREICYKEIARLIRFVEGNAEPFFQRGAR